MLAVYASYHALCHLPCIPAQLRPGDQWQCNKCMTSMYGISNSVYDFALDHEVPLYISIDYTAQSAPPLDHPLAPAKMVDDVHEELRHRQRLGTFSVTCGGRVSCSRQERITYLSARRLTPNVSIF